MTDPSNVEAAVRPASSADAEEVAAVFRRSRAAGLPWLPVLHTAEEDLAFFASQLTIHRSWVAVVDGRIGGFSIAGEGWLHHLYIEPQLRGTGLGSALLDASKDACPAGLKLWAFERNVRAQDFYSHRGFVEILRTDGSGNEEKEPDVLMQWSPVAYPPISERTA